MDIQGKNLLVIGGAGLIGSHTIDKLLAEDVGSVTVYDNFARGREENLAEAFKDPRVSVYEVGGDILQTDILDAAMKDRKIDGVFHLAALWLLQCHDYPRSAFNTNVAGTFNVMEACVKNDIKRLVWSSSASVYGDAVTEPMEEDHPFNNKNFYGATKIAGEAMLRSFHHRYGLDYVGLRYMNVYGPRQDQTAVYTGVIPIVLNRIDAGEPPVVNGDGTQAYDFVSVNDVARSNVLALTSEATDGFYNVGTGIQTTVRELCETMLDLTGSDLDVEYRPYADGDARALVQNRIGSTEAAARDLGFEARTSLRQGLAELIEWRSSGAA